MDGRKDLAVRLTFVNTGLLCSYDQALRGLNDLRGHCLLRRKRYLHFQYWPSEKKNVNMRYHQRIGRAVGMKTAFFSGQERKKAVTGYEERIRMLLENH